MYDIVKEIINHTWISGTNTPGDQTVVYYIASVAFLILLVVFVDMIYKILSSFIRHIKL